MPCWPINTSKCSTACRLASNDMTQLTLGLDRDSALVADDFDERDDAVKALSGHDNIAACKKQGKVRWHLWSGSVRSS